MVDATKNKRGRPKTVNRILADTTYTDKEPRAAMNLLYAAQFIQLLPEQEQQFFLTQKGNIKRQGIAEQIGRLYAKELISETECIELAKLCIADYNSGIPSKQIERYLRQLRQDLTSN